MKMENEVLKYKSLVVLAASAKAYMQLGWKPKGRIVEHNDGYALEMERGLGQRSYQPIRQRSWVAWPKFDI